MAVYIKPKHTTPAAWAKASLAQAGVSVLKVVRVFPPLDSGEPAECLYLDERQRPRTAWICSDGRVGLNTSGW